MAAVARRSGGRHESAPFPGLQLEGEKRMGRTVRSRHSMVAASGKLDPPGSFNWRGPEKQKGPRENPRASKERSGNQGAGWVGEVG